MGPEDRSAILERLKEVVEQTRLQYLEAKEGLARAKELQADLGATHPDGTLRMSFRNHDTTLRNYSVALWRYNRLILDGKLPDEEKGPPQN